MYKQVLEQNLEQHSNNTHFQESQTTYTNSQFPDNSI